ncbi:MAG: glycosyltransferase family 2 protein [Nitrospirae bacterium]|nr:glycosyltransferase family 2 protein [Nitrospirota bacterium]
MKVSVIISTYNSPAYLKKVLDGFLCQKTTPDEIIIADDGSGSDTAELIQKSSALFSFPLLHVWQENKGFRAGKIRNGGIARSSGDYIILLDGDCVVNRNFVSDHLSLAEAGYFVQGKRVLVDKDAMDFFDHHHANSFLTLWNMALTGSLSNIHHLIRLPYGMSIKNKKLVGIKSCNMSFFRKDVMAVNGFNENYIGWGNEDSDLACRFVKYGLTKKTSPFGAICFHLWHPTNKTIGDLNKKLLDDTISSDAYFCENGIFKRNQH